MIQEIARKYPYFIHYRVKSGAPYGITCEGSIVEIASYLEDGNVSVLLRAENKTQEAKVHESFVGAEHHKTKEEMQDIHEADVRTIVEPKWLEPVKRVDFSLDMPRN